MELKTNIKKKVKHMKKQDFIKKFPDVKVQQFPEYFYEQIYDTILCDIEFNPLYRIHGQLKLKNKKRR